MNGLITVANFLITTFFGLAIFMMWARFGITYCKVNRRNPVCQAVLTLTDKIVAPLQTLIKPSTIKNKLIDWPTLLVIIFLELLKACIKSLFLPKVVSMFKWTLVLSVTDFLATPFDFLFYAVLIRVLISYLHPQWPHPAFEVLKAFTQPILNLAHKLVPDVSGFDFSPIIALTLLKVINIFILSSLPPYFL